MKKRPFETDCVIFHILLNLSIGSLIFNDHTMVYMCVIVLRLLEWYVFRASISFCLFQTKFPHLYHKVCNKHNKEQYTEAYKTDFHCAESSVTEVKSF